MMMSFLRKFLNILQYLGHIGSADVELSTNHLTVIQNQMQSKGGYDMNSLRMQVKQNCSLVNHVVTNLKIIFQAC